ncbi:hypothetical protein B7P43_G15612, partial [Cryptotermes secundus]
WKIKINETKYVQVNFTLRREHCPQVLVRLYNNNIPQSPRVKYLGIHMDSRLTWKDHVINKRKQIDLKTKDLNWLIGRRYNLSIENEVLLCKTIIKPIWAYGIELLGCARKSNILIIQRSQSKILRTITNAPWYVNNQTLHTDLNIPYIKDDIREKSTSHHKKQANYPNDILQPLVEPQHNRRLRRHWPADLKENCGRDSPRH